MGQSLKTSSSLTGSCWLALFLCGSVGCAKPSKAEKFGPMPEPQTLAYRGCQADQDCEYVQNGCCDCVNGGADLAINKNQRAAFRAQFDCTSGGCTERGGACGLGTVSCDQGLCTFHHAP
jgi:hypothetical protein